MANDITINTVTRGILFAYTNRKFSDGGDYRACQKGVWHAIKNWIIDHTGFAKRTQNEINYKKTALRKGFAGLVENLLAAPVDQSGNLQRDVRFDVDSCTFTLKSEGGKIFLQDHKNPKECIQLLEMNANDFKAAILQAYLKEYGGKLSNYAGKFNLRGINFSGAELDHHDVATVIQDGGDVFGATITGKPSDDSTLGDRVLNQQQLFGMVSQRDLNLHNKIIGTGYQLDKNHFVELAKNIQTSHVEGNATAEINPNFMIRKGGDILLINLGTKTDLAKLSETSARRDRFLHPDFWYRLDGREAPSSNSPQKLAQHRFFLSMMACKYGLPSNGIYESTKIAQFVNEDLACHETLRSQLKRFILTPSSCVLTNPLQDYLTSRPLKK